MVYNFCIYRPFLTVATHPAASECAPNFRSAEKYRGWRERGERSHSLIGRRKGGLQSSQVRLLLWSRSSRSPPRTPRVRPVELATAPSFRKALEARRCSPLRGKSWLEYFSDLKKSKKKRKKNGHGHQKVFMTKSHK